MAGGTYANAAANGSSSHPVHTTTSLKRWSCDDDHALPPVGQVKAIHIYDFDNTLFASPLPNKQIWEQTSIGTLMHEKDFVGGGWFHDNNILSSTGEGLEKEEPKAWEGWWNENIAELCRLSIQQNDAFSVLLTGRGENRFADLIKRILKSKGLSFHMICLKPAAGPANQSFRSTMNFKQTLLTDIVHTYNEAEEIKIYEDRIAHVEQFRTFFSDFNRELMGPNPQTQRRTIACEVIEVVTKATFLDPVTEIAEVQRMINAHNIAYKSGTAGRNAMPMQIDRKMFSTGYLVSAADVENLYTLMPPAVRSNRNIRKCANIISITRGTATPHILQSVGGLGKRVRFRITGLGVLDNRIWAASIEPVPATEKVLVLDRPPALILGMSHKAQPKDINFIDNWTPVTAAQALEFDTTVGEKVILKIVPEQLPNRGNTAGTKRVYDPDSNQQDFIGLGNSGPPPQGSNKRSGISNNYRGGSQNRGRGRDRREETGRGGRGGRGGHSRGGGGPYGRGGRGGRGGGNQQQHHRQSGDDHGQQRGGYTDYDAAGGRNEQGGSGMYNAY